MMYASKNAEKLFKIFLISVPSSACMFFATLGLNTNDEYYKNS